jgi:hypothetical protein
LKLNPFNVKCWTIHRYFSIQNACKDLKYQPSNRSVKRGSIALVQRNGCRGFEQQEEKKAGKTGGVTIEQEGGLVL